MKSLPLRVWVTELTDVEHLRFGMSRSSRAHLYGPLRVGDFLCGQDVPSTPVVMGAHASAPARLRDYREGRITFTSAPCAVCLDSADRWRADVTKDEKRVQTLIEFSRKNGLMKAVEKARRDAERILTPEKLLRRAQLLRQKQHASLAEPFEDQLRWLEAQGVSY